MEAIYYISCFKNIYTVTSRSLKGKLIITEATIDTEKKHTTVIFSLDSSNETNIVIARVFYWTIFYVFLPSVNKIPIIKVVLRNY